MTEQPIKLTDDALRSLLHGLGMHYPLGEAKQIVDAIRALRDRAKAVWDATEVNSCMECSCEYVAITDARAIDALGKVLPP